MSDVVVFDSLGPAVDLETDAKGDDDNLIDSG